MCRYATNYYAMRELMWHFDGRTWRTVVVLRGKSEHCMDSPYITPPATDHMQSTTTAPIAIQVKKTKTDNYIGTCRSYDEKQPVPSFVRSLTPDAEKKQNNQALVRRKRLISE